MPASLFLALATFHIRVLSNRSHRIQLRLMQTVGFKMKSLTSSKESLEKTVLRIKTQVRLPRFYPISIQLLRLPKYPTVHRTPLRSWKRASTQCFTRQLAQLQAISGMKIAVGL